MLGCICVYTRLFVAILLTIPSMFAYTIQSIQSHGPTAILASHYLFMVRGTCVCYMLISLDVLLVINSCCCYHCLCAVLPYPRAPVLPYPRAPVLPYPRAPVLSYPRAPVLPYPRAPVLPYPRAPVLPGYCNYTFHNFRLSYFM